VKSSRPPTLEGVQQKGPVRAQILILADRQYGHVTRRQLLALGVSPRWVRSQVQLGWLIPVHAGVYAVGHVPRHVLARAKAALLACGATAALSYRAAAALWDVGEWPDTFEVSVIGYRRRPGVRVYRPQELSAHDVRVRQGLRVTSPVRTALDLRAQLADGRLIRLMNDLRIAGHLGPTAVTELRLRSARIDRLLGDGRLTRSELEDLFRAFVTRHHLPMPEINTRLPGTRREVDALYRDARLIVELDSWKFHQDRESFEDDRQKDARALAAGFRTLRTTERRLSRGGDAEAATIRQILAGTR
jgi:very-short-patch-repair endonuclease